MHRGSWEGHEADNPYRVEVKERNKLQVILLRRMLGDDITDLGAQEAWANTYGKKISDIIDAPDNHDLRQLIRSGEYDRAADEVMRMMAN